MIDLDPIKDNEKGVKAENSVETTSGQVIFGKVENDDERTTD